MLGLKLNRVSKRGHWSFKKCAGSVLIMCISPASDKTKPLPEPGISICYVISMLYRNSCLNQCWLTVIGTHPSAFFFQKLRKAYMLTRIIIQKLYFSNSSPRLPGVKALTICMPSSIYITGHILIMNLLQTPQRRTKYYSVKYDLFIFKSDLFIDSAVIDLGYVLTDQTKFYLFDTLRRTKMATILQATFSNTLSWQKVTAFWFKHYWSLLLRKHTVYPKKYAHGFCFAVLSCGYTLNDFPISIRLTSLALWQSNDCPSASKATLMDMDKYFTWIHYERLHNHNKAKHNKTVCIFLGIYCMSSLGYCLVADNDDPVQWRIYMYQRASVC